MSLLVQFIDGMDVPVIIQRRYVATVKVPKIQFIAGVGGHSSSHETGTGMAAMVFFGLFYGIFRAPSIRTSSAR